MLNTEQFADLVIKPTLVHLGMYSQAAENLLLGTAMQESRLTFLKQLHKGPAVGVLQMEPATYRDVWRYLDLKPHLSTRVRDLASHYYSGTTVPPSEMIGNLYYATAIARIKYWMSPDPLPHADDIKGLAKYWKRIYNTELGKGKVEEFIKNYPR